MYSSGGRCFQHGRGDRTSSSAVAYWSGSNFSPRRRAAYSWVRSYQKALQNPAVLHGVDQVDPGPFRQTRHQVLFTAMREVIPEPLQLSVLFVALHDEPVAVPK